MLVISMLIVRGEMGSVSFGVDPVFCVGVGEVGEDPVRVGVVLPELAVGGSEGTGVVQRVLRV